MTWFYIISTAGALLLLLLLYREWTRSNTRLRAARCLASLVLIASLLGFCYPKQTAPATSKGEIILLTTGYTKDSLASFQRMHANDSLFSIDDAGEGLPVADWKSFLSEHPTTRLHVFGNGLSSEQIAALHERPIQFHPSPQQPCITDVFWKQELLTGEPLRVQGRFHNTNSTVSLLLRAYGSNKDSITIAPGADSSFELKTIPEQTGTGLYELVSIAGSDTIARETIPFSVAKGEGPRLLILSSAPDFDNSYLKNTLSALGYTVAMNTTVSSGKREQQELNTSEKERQADVSFNQFDVVLADPLALKSLNAADLSSLRSSINENGTGLIIRTDTAANQLTFVGAGAAFTGVRETKAAVLFKLPDSSQFPLPSGNKVALIPGTGQRALLADASNNCFALEQTVGRGRIIVSTLLNSFSIALAGNKDAYLQLWSTLLEAAGQRNTNNSWQVSPLLAQVYAPQLLQWESDQTDSMASVGKTSLAFNKDTRVPGVQQTVFWPETSGWHSVESRAGKKYWYVFPKQAWQQIRSYQRRSITADYANKHRSTSEGRRMIEEKTSSYLQLLFLILFLGAAAFLWMEQKQG